MLTAAPVLVAACGNAMAGDDALGPMAAAAVRRLGLPGVEVVDLDLRPAALLDCLGRPRRLLLVIDAVDMPGAPPAALVDCDWQQTGRPALMHDDVLSTHGLSIASQLELAGKLGMLPKEVRLLGAVVEHTALGGSTARLGAAVNAIVRRIAALAEAIRSEACHA